MFGPSRTSLMRTFVKDMSQEDLDTPIGKALQKDLTAAVNSDHRPTEIWKLALGSVCFLAFFAAGFIPGLNETHALNFKLVGGFVGLGAPLAWKAGEELSRLYGGLSEARVKQLANFILNDMVCSEEQTLQVKNYFVGDRDPAHRRLADQLRKNLQSLEGKKEQADASQPTSQ